MRASTPFSGFRMQTSGAKAVPPSAAARSVLRQECSKSRAPHNASSMYTNPPTVSSVVTASTDVAIDIVYRTGAHRRMSLWRLQV